MARTCTAFAIRCAAFVRCVGACATLALLSAAHRSDVAAWPHSRTLRVALFVVAMRVMAKECRVSLIARWPSRCCCRPSRTGVAWFRSVFGCVRAADSVRWQRVCAARQRASARSGARAAFALRSLVRASLARSFAYRTSSSCPPATSRFVMRCVSGALVTPRDCRCRAPSACCKCDTI